MLNQNIYAGSCQYGADLEKQLIAMLQNVLWSCGSVRISFSRRTPEKVKTLKVSVCQISQ